jgi:hypothetical protein
MPESRAVQVRINGAQLAKPGQEQFGSYAANDPMDDRFVQRQFPLDAQGNLYRGIRDMLPGVDSDADLAWHGPDFSAYTNAYTKENHAFPQRLVRLHPVARRAQTTPRMPRTPRNCGPSPTWTSGCATSPSTRCSTTAKTAWATGRAMISASIAAPATPALS